MRVTRRIVPGFLLVAVAVALLASGTRAAPRARTAPLATLESSVLVDINAFRAEHGLSRLRLSPELSEAARGHSDEMAVDGYFAHHSAGGEAFWKRIERFYPSQPWRYWSVGENLLWRSPGIDAGDALRLWLASPEHRANLLNPRWREIGVAAVHVSRAPGMFKGMPVTLVTTDFGVRR